MESPEKPNTSQNSSPNSSQNTSQKDSGIDSPISRRAKIVTTMRILGVLYALGAALLFFFPNEIIYLVNVGPRVFRITEAIPEAADSIWNLWASSLWATLSAVSFFGAESSAPRGYLLIHQLAKAMMISGALYYFLNSHRYFAYIMIGTSEALLFIIVLWTSLTTRRSVPAGGNLK